MFYCNIVGVSIPGLRVGEHVHADSIGDRLGAVFDHPLFQTDALILPILEIKIGIVRLFRQGSIENFLQITALYAEIVAKKRRRQICCCHIVSSEKVLTHKSGRIKLFLAHPRAFKRIEEQQNLCSSNVIMTGANGNVIMSGWGNDNPDDARREATRRNTTSVSKRADRGASRTGDGIKRTAVLPGQSTSRKGRSQRSRSWQPWTAV